MFEATAMLFIYVETPLHPGTGRGVGAVDLPIQRERTTGYPVVQASSVKGRLRAETRDKIQPVEHYLAVFGPEAGSDASEHAGALSTGDARLLLFPVRSLAGVFAWVTSVNALARFQREAAMTQLSLTIGEPSQTIVIPPEPGKDEAWVNGTTLVAGNSVVLEEFSFTPKQDHAKTIAALGKWLAEKALPQTSEYAHWRETLPKKLCVLPEDTYRDFVLYGTEVQTHIKLNPDTKTVEQGALWTSESLPIDTLLYAPVMATQSRKNGVTLTAKEILQKVADVDLPRTHLGGDETTGQGMVALRFAGGGK